MQTKSLYDPDCLVFPIHSLCNFMNMWKNAILPCAMGRRNLFTQGGHSRANHPVAHLPSWHGAQFAYVQTAAGLLGLHPSCFTNPYYTTVVGWNAIQPLLQSSMSLRNEMRPVTFNPTTFANTRTETMRFGAVQQSFCPSTVGYKMVPHR